uniref:EB domain-containing protein n=1 Tax=Enterobius vermicularis TaxID=51028 RepID=A0A0N4UTE1_ENTVE
LVITVSRCRTSVLSCPIEQVLVNGLCIERVPPGQRCRHSLQCYDASECSTDTHRCVCATGMHLIGEYCRKLLSDDPCNQTSSVRQTFIILRPPRGSECKLGYCLCPENSELIGSYCVSTKATCAMNQVMVNKRCFNTAELGQPCQVTDQCKGNGECTYAGICSCPSGKKEVDGFCQVTLGLQCPVSQIQIGEVCYPRVKPSSNCTHPEQCLDGSTCTNNTCTCPSSRRLVNNYCVSASAGFCNETQISINGECLELQQPGHSCTNNIQCLGSSTCPTELHYLEFFQLLIDGHCYNYAYVHQYCVHNQQCIGGAQCRNNFCACEPGYIWENTSCVNANGNCAPNQIHINGMCYDLLYIGQYCYFSQQCLGGSICRNGYCQCPSGTTKTGSRCVFSNTTACTATQVGVNGTCYERAPIGA